MKGDMKIRAADQRQRRFVLEYCKDLNATAAATRAGFSTKGARVQGSRLLANPNIAAAIRAKLDTAALRADITVARTLKQIARIAYADIRELYDEKGILRPIHELDEDTAAMLAGVETEELYTGSGEKRISIGILRKVKLRDMGKALDQCMSYLGMHKTGDQAQDKARGLQLTITYSDGRHCAGSAKTMGGEDEGVRRN